MKLAPALGLSAGLWVALALARLAEGIVPDFGDMPLLASAATMVGLGVGLLSQGSHRPGEELLSALLRLIILLTAYALLGLFYLSPDPAGVIRSTIGLGLPITLFIAHVLVFIPLGRALTPSLETITARDAYRTALPAAAFNTGLFLLLHFLDTPLSRLVPAAAYLLFWGFLLKLPKRGMVLSALLAAVALTLAAAAGFRLTWSRHVLLPVPTASTAARTLLPPEPDGGRAGQLPQTWTGTIIDGLFLDFAVDLDPIRLGMNSSQTPSESAILIGMSDFYRLPFRLRPPGRALVLNSGLGNSLAAGWREGWQALEAQEEDPALLRLGKSHPERPYQAPGLVLHQTPARQLINKAPGAFDLIVIAPALTPPAFWSGTRTARALHLFTTESFKLIAERLSSDGIVAVAIAAPHGFVERRLFQMLSDRFGSASAWRWQNHAWNEQWTLIAAGPGVRRYRPRPGPGLEDITADIRRRPNHAAATDSWPYLLLPGPGLSFVISFNLISLILIGGIGLIPGRAFRGLQPAAMAAGALAACMLMREWNPVPTVAVWALCLSALAVILLAVSGGKASLRLGSAAAGFGLAGPTSYMLPWFGSLWPLVAGVICLLLLAGVAISHARR